MLKNLIKVALRNIIQNRIYSLLNVVGLTLGITCSFFLGLYILDELSFDNFHTKSDRIYRVVSKFIEGNKETEYPSSQGPLGPELKQKYSIVEQTVRIAETGRELFEQPETDNRFYEVTFFYADPSVFEVFDFNLIQGDKTTALTKPFTAVLSESTASKYFGDIDPLGKTIENKGKIFEIVGVMENSPNNSHLQLDALLSFESVEPLNKEWGAWFPRTYLLLKPNADPKEINKALASVNKEHVAPIFDSYGIKIQYWGQPLSDIHLKTGFNDPLSKNGSITYIYVFSAVALIILIIANINYVNLATARATQRAKEIGIRKTMGSVKSQIVIQFVTESTMITLMAVVLSFLLVLLLLPSFNQFSGKQIGFLFLLQPQIILTLLLLAISIGILGGAYPAFYLSHFNPALVLKGNLTRGAGGVKLKKILIVAQFSVSIGMLICTSIVFDQLQYLREKDLGFNQEQVITAIMPDSLIVNNFSVLQERLKANSSIVEVSSSAVIPGQDIFYSIMHVDSPEGDVTRGINFFFADYGFVETMGMSITKGRDFSRDFTDTLSVLVNEAMVEKMNWDDAIGKHFTFDDGNKDTIEPTYTVVGVIKNYHQQSLHSPIVPLAIFFKNGNYNLNIRISYNDISASLNLISSIWSEVNPDKPFAYKFLDQDFQSLYSADEKRGKMFSLFASVSVIISCIGLFGLAAYTTEQRAKEIGIRKVIGASIGSILVLFYKDFLILIGWALLVAFPVTYFFMEDWLKTFAYQTDIKIFTFVESALLMSIITIVSVGYYAIKLAKSNPATTLRRE